MNFYTIDTSTDTWVSSGWIIRPGYGTGDVDMPPPRAAEPNMYLPYSTELSVMEGLRVMEIQEYLEFLEDLAIAEKVEEEYFSGGIEGTVPYGQYRNRRLGSEPAV